MQGRDEVLVRRAVVPHPPGINRAYRSARGQWYKTRDARQWEQDAMLALRAAGWRHLPDGRYWLSCSLVVVTLRLDVDAPVKVALDLIAEALGRDDREVAHLNVTKVWAASSADQRLEVRVTARAVRSREEWGVLSLASATALGDVESAE